MHRSPEQARRPQKQRPDLSLNTAAAASRSRDVAPESLPSRKSFVPPKGPPVSNRGLKLPASALATNSKRNSEESFLDHDSPIDGERVEPDYRHFRPPRDSHDLSLPSQKFTRDSLLGNMLNSLDQFSLSQVNTSIASASEDDGDPYGVPRGDTFTRSTASTSRPPNTYTAGNPHVHGYSYSSDFEGFDDAASRISSQVSRGRRSDSSSGFQSGLPRINSMRERSHPGTLHTRGGKASKSSSLNSFDVGGGGYTQALPSQRRGHEVGGRSSSFDYGQRPSLSSPGPEKTEFSNSFLVDDYEAAPNPTVPGGPRRPLLPSFSAASATAPPSEYEPKTPDRKRDAKSRSGANKTTQSKFATSRDAAQSPLPTLDVDSAPAPLVGYGKSKDPQQAVPSPAPPVKEKQGFFSRLFGSRSSPSPAAESFNVPVPSVAPESSQSGTGKMDHVASQMKPLSAPPTRDSESSRQMPHVIQKKSSFFRRRKKSIAEPPVPPLPVPHQIDISKAMDASIPKAEPSPVSSLRQVMSPYLRGSNPATPRDLLTSQRDSAMHTFETEARGEDNRHIRGFSPEYEPIPSATIRTVKSTSALKSHDSPWRSHLESPLRNAPDVPAKLPKSPESTTFLHDSSDEGERGKLPAHKQRQRAQTGKHDSTGAALKLNTLSPEHQDSAELDSLKPEPSPNLPLQKNTRQPDQSPGSREAPIGNSSSRPMLSRSASSVPSVTVDSSQASPQVPNGPLDEPEVTVGEPTEDDRQKAQGIYDGDEDFIQKEKAAAWMGEEGPVRQRTLRAYMDLYDFENESILAALRQVCSRLVFKAETQQVDRILIAFSKRWCQCNPNHGFKTRGKHL
ncbi:hypothetical protein RRF57_001524 [Xylaria bambusicola]|uniref:SEC7 domain-containing protein n=1 Tax=Xylaria bambusicola TaxID=326684 RepID=A0AAN7Z3L3_9PEZI